jgi:hypothetical protein
MDKLTNKDLANWVRTYGGIIEALEHGITSERIDDPELANAWRRMTEQYAAMRPNMSIVNRMLSASRRAA